jgi:hypothetical protein
MHEFLAVSQIAIEASEEPLPGQKSSPVVVF